MPKHPKGAQPPRNLKRVPCPPELKGLGPLAHRAYHWMKATDPKLFRALHQKGQLHKHLATAEKLTQEAMEQTVRQLEAEGYDPVQAELTAQELIFPEWLEPAPESGPALPGRDLEFPPPSE